MLEVSVRGQPWLTGGAFGPEAGLSSLVALVLGFAVLWTLRVRGAFAGAAETSEAYASRTGRI